MRLIGLALLVFALLLAACKSEPGPRYAPGASPSPVARATPVADSAVAASPESLFLEITAPKDEIVLNESSLVVLGQTVADAVVSVNGQSVELDANGNFAATVALEQGPNAIEIIASDFRGNQESRVISVIRTS